MGQPEPRPGRRLLPRSGAPPGNKRTDERLAKSTQAPASAQNQALQSLDLTRKDSKKPKLLPVHSPAAVSRFRAHSAQTSRCRGSNQDQERQPVFKYISKAH